MDLFVWELVSETTHHLALETPGRDDRATGDSAYPREAA
jgi:hypothetical protein